MAPPTQAAHAAAVTAHQRCGGCCYLSGLCPFCNLASALLRREQLARDFSLHVSDLLHDEREGLKAMLRADADADAAEQAHLPCFTSQGEGVARRRPVTSAPHGSR